MTVCDSAGNEYYLVEVIAFVLKHLKEQFVERLGMMAGDPLKTTDFEWVITVPAIWQAGGKQMMREAAYLVSTIYSESPVLLIIYRLIYYQIHLVLSVLHQ